MHPQTDSDGAWLAPAKLNLTLRILGRRPDGYHRLQTVFQFLDRCDRLFLTPRDDGKIRRLRGAEGVPAEQDLVVRAALLLQSHTGTTAGVDIELDKRLPMGGGLGGGSSNAATTLQALNQLWALGLDIDQLAQLGLQLGADVPVFVRGWAAWAEGVGEELVPVDLPCPHYLVLRPPVGVSTARIFNDTLLTRDSPAATMADFVAGDHRNDCLERVLALYPEVAEAHAWLDRETQGQARLTGTGCCLFAAFEDPALAEATASRADPGLAPFVARGLNRSPLFG